MLRDYGAHITAVTTHSSLLQNRNTDSKSHSLQKLKNNKKCSSKDEIEACRYFLQELLQRKRGSLQDTTAEKAEARFASSQDVPGLVCRPALVMVLITHFLLKKEIIFL